MKSRNILTSIVLLTSILMTTLVYSAYNTRLNIEGDAIVRSDQYIRITNITVSETTSGAHETYNNKYNKDVTFMYATLPANSSITYTIEITNKNTISYIIDSISQESHTNTNVSIDISLNINDIVGANSTQTFTIKLTNNTNTTQEETLVYKYGFHLNQFTVTFDEGNMFTANNSNYSGLEISYDDDTEILTINGTSTSSIDVLEFYSYYDMEFEEGDIYTIEKKYISGTSTLSGSNTIAAEILDSTRKNLSNRYYLDATLGESSITKTKVVHQDAETNGKILSLRLWFSQGANMNTFNNYKIKVALRKTSTKQVQYQSPYGELLTPTRKGYTFKGWSILPEGYIQVESISNTTLFPTLGAYIDTGVKINSTNYSKVRFKTDMSIQETGGAWYLMGIANNDSTYVGMYANRFFYGTGIANDVDTGIVVPDKNGRYLYNLDVPANTLVVKDYNTNEEVVNINLTTRGNNATTTGRNIYLMAWNNSDGISPRGVASTLYNSQIYMDGQKIRDFIPCYRKSDNKPGLYDLVNNVFYTNSNLSSNDFTYGNLEYITSSSIVNYAKDHTLTAIWEPAQYNVTFDPNGGTVDTSSKQVTYLSTYGALPTPTRTGYIFKGWNGNQKYDQESEIFGNGTIMDGNNIILDGSQVSNNIGTYILAQKYLNGNYVSEYFREGTKTFTKDNSYDQLLFKMNTSRSDPYFYMGKNLEDGKQYTISYDVIFRNYQLPKVILSNLIIAEGTEVIKWEPYYITSDTTVVYPNNHTLTAIWELDSTQNEFEFNYSGKEQYFTVPKTGTYQLETWGAQGGAYTTNDVGRGGYGGYSVGEISLSQGSKLYVNTGGQGKTCTWGSNYCNTSGGYNGGGNAYSKNQYNSGGGGATHIATVSGELKNLSSYKDTGGTNISNEILIVAAGGGGGGYALVGDSSGPIETASAIGTGGEGGGYKGTTGIDHHYPNGYYGSGATQLIGGCPHAGNNSTPFSTTIGIGQFGQGGQYNALIQCCGNSGGGAGWYGGGASTRGHGGAGGGSGYLNTNLTNKKMIVYSTDSTYESTNVSDKTEISTCVNTSPISNCAKASNGYAKITYLGN